MANKVREERMKRGLSINKLSQLTSIGASDLSMLERGQRPAYPGWRRRIARAFKMDSDFLFTDKVIEK